MIVIFLYRLILSIYTVIQIVLLNSAILIMITVVIMSLLAGLVGGGEMQFVSFQAKCFELRKGKC